ncbi:MAG: short-chain dehydrogenase [Arthrobacter sp.]|jgi:hypothetical protein|nr:short-chain dehydrogenase [Arthrobacter sp.]
MGRRELTVDGHENAFQVNHLALNSARNYSTNRAYGTAKPANNLFTAELNHRYAGERAVGRSEALVALDLDKLKRRG